MRIVSTITVATAAVAAVCANDGAAQSAATPAQPPQICATAGGATFLCGPALPEDLFLIPKTNWVVSSSMQAGLHLIDARAKGIPYVAEGERQRAKTAFRRGEGLFRARSWSEADPLLEEAYTLDPLTWPYALYSAQSGYLTRRLDGEAALKRLGAHAGDTPVRQAEVLFARAAIARLEGRAEEALKLCRAALKKDPDNRDAQREVRLHERRNPVVAP